MRREPVVMLLGVGRWRWVYEGVMAALALVVVASLLAGDEPWVATVNRGVWALFVFDYALRLGLSTDRRAFVRANVVDLLAIMPADAFRGLRVLRLARLLRLVRAARLLHRVMRDVRGVVSTNGLSWVLLIAVTSILLGAVMGWLVEPGIETFGDGVWWAIVTTTTVGYGDLSPETTAVRFVAVLLMLFGIGSIGMVTASIATYFIKDEGVGDPDVRYIRERLGEWAVLNSAERQRLVRMLDAVARSTPDGATDGASDAAAVAVATDHET